MPSAPKTSSRLRSTALKGDGGGFTLLGVYHVEPQCSAYPFSFPFGDTPDHWRLGEHFSLTEDSVFWFNFFPEQPYLFEKTFAVWALFQMLQLTGRGENNQLVAFDGRESLIAQGVSDFVQVNLNRFTSLPGFFNAAHEAGKQTFTVDPGLHLVRHAAEESVGAAATRAQRGRSTSTKKTLPPSGFCAKLARAPIRSAKTRTI